MALATLSIDLVAQLAQLQAGMDKAGRLAEKNAAQIESAYGKAAKVGQVLGAALGGAISVAGITAFVRATVDGIDKLNDLSDATGATIENLSALEDIGARTGTSIDTIGDAVLKLNKVLSDAEVDSPMARQLQAIGLNVEQLKKLDPAEAFRQVAVALAGWADNGDRARVVQELFGKSTAQVAALLKDVAEAGRLVATVTSDQARAADAFNKQLFELQKNITDAGRGLAMELVPALNEVVSVLNGKGAAGELNGALATTLQTVAVLGANVAFVFKGVGTEIGGLLAQAGALSRLDFGGAATIGEAMREDAKAAREEFDRLERRLMQLGTIPTASYSNEGRLPGLPSIPVVGGKKKGGEPPYTIKPMEPLGLSESALAALRAIQGTDVAKIQEINAALDELFAMRASGLGGDASIDAAIEKLRGDLEALSPAARAAAEEKKRLDAILKQTPTAVFADVLTDIELINKAFEAGKISVEQWAEAVRVATGKLPQELEKPLEQISEFSREASRNIQDSLGDTILASMKGNSEEIEDIWKNMLMRMVAQAAAAQLSESLFGKGYGSTTSNLGGFFGWLGSMAGGSGVNGSHAGGLSYVPFDGYRAELHRGERVLTADQARAQDAGMGGPLAVINVQGDFGQNAQKAVDVSLSRFLMKTSRRRGAGA